MSIPRDLKVEIPGHGTGKINTRLRARRAEARGADGQGAARHPDQPRRQRELRRLPARGQPPRLRLRRHRPALLQRPRRPGRLRDDRPQARLPEALRPGLAGLRALPPHRRRLRARRAPAGLPAPGQGADRPRQGLRRPQGAAEDLRALHADRHRPRQRRGDPAAPQARLRVVEERRSTRCRFRAAQSDDPRATSRSRRENLQKTVDEFIDVGVGATPTRQPTSAGAQEAQAHQDAQAARAGPRPAPGGRREPRPDDAPTQAAARLPVYFPKAIVARGGYSAREPALVRHLRPQQEPYRAYRLVLSRGRDRPVLRRAGHDLEGAADPRQPDRRGAHAQAHVPALLRRHARSASSPGRRRRPSTGSPTRSRRR